MKKIYRACKSIYRTDGFLVQEVKTFDNTVAWTNDDCDLMLDLIMAASPESRNTRMQMQISNLENITPLIQYYIDQIQEIYSSINDFKCITKEESLAMTCADNYWKQIVYLYKILPKFSIGIEYCDSQKRKAKKPRGKISEGGQTVSGIISHLAQSVEYTDDGAPELWNRFYGLLDDERLDPKESVSCCDSKKSYIEYDGADGRRKQITFGRFSNAVSENRKDKKSR